MLHGLDQGRPLPVDLADLPPELAAPRATFVTLTRGGRLRGCVGRLQAERPLAQDVAANAYAAAFEDSRFQPLERAELAGLGIHVALLTAPEPILFTGEADLLRQLEPGVDGLVLEAGRRRATFLPAVWASLPEPADFLRELKVKAGLGAGEVPGLRAWRYFTECVED